MLQADGTREGRMLPQVNIVTPCGMAVRGKNEIDTVGEDAQIQPSRG